MEATVNIVKTYTLSMDQKSAQILKDLFQNPLAKDEPQELTDLRAKIWHALDKAGVGHQL